ncbi:MAG: T9SS type A sorting domain-containing protein [Bacteroidetes bacterium]|nr:T9SS type A sorting domain-containing protein [Bacteroidota bacterium]
MQSFTGKVINALRAPIGSDAVTGLTDAGGNMKPIVFPNPTTGIINVVGFLPDNYSIELTNLQGKIVYYKSGSAFEKVNADLSRFPEGVYFMKVLSSAGTSTHKIILTK